MNKNRETDRSASVNPFMQALQTSGSRDTLGGINVERSLQAVWFGPTTGVGDDADSDPMELAGFRGHYRSLAKRAGGSGVHETLGIPGWFDPKKPDQQIRISAAAPGRLQPPIDLTNQRSGFSKADVPRFRGNVSRIDFNFRG